MITFTPAALLAAWERCLPLPPVRRAVTLLELAEPSVPAETITALPIGSRDRELLRLRVSAFGAEITGLAACPACAETVEIAADANTIIASVPDAASGGEELTFDRDGYHVSFRLPTSEDLIALGASAAQTEPERFLLARCLRWVECGGSPMAASELPNEIIELIASSMNEHDPLADIELACMCPECGHSWTAPLDVVAFLWAELSDYATRLLEDVHVLASAYGWREGDILALTPTRRQAYLELIGG
jgi:hypothetical protein